MTSMDMADHYKGMLRALLNPFLPAVREWWAFRERKLFHATGCIPVVGTPNLYIRFSRTPKKSPIYGVQAFPFVPAPAIPMTGVLGGVKKFFELVCADEQFMVEEFVIVERHGLPATYLQGQILAFVPKTVLEEGIGGQWVFVTYEQAIQVLAEGVAGAVLRKKFERILDRDIRELEDDEALV